MSGPTKVEARVALSRLCAQLDSINAPAMLTLQAVIDAMPDDPESRAERLGRVCREAFEDNYNHAGDWCAAHIAAAAAVEAECPKPREVTSRWIADNATPFYATLADRINRYVRGEDA